MSSEYYFPEFDELSEAELEALDHDVEEEEEDDELPVEEVQIDPARAPTLPVMPAAKPAQRRPGVEWWDD